MNYKLQLLFSFLFIYSTSYSQNIGGFDAGEMTPREVKATDISQGIISGNVNLLDGTYNYSQPLATVATPSGLSYTMQLSYNSTNTVGNSPSNVSGLPYGEGWGVNIPKLSISSTEKTKYDCNDVNYSQNETKEFTLEEILAEGDVYYLSPQLSIPGVCSGRLVYKYTDDVGPVFVLHEFEQYVEARPNGSEWEVKLWDGTIWRFALPLITYRSPTNQRILKTSDTGYDLQDNAAALGQVTLPKVDILAFYPSQISHPNHPSGNVIDFTYDSYGAFNFYKEFLDRSILQGYTYYENDSIQDLEGQSGYNFVSFPEYREYEEYKDVILDKVLAFGTLGKLAETIEFKHKTYYFSNASHLPQLGDANYNITRKDSLYNITKVYEINEQGGMSNWTRYRHFRSDEVQSYSSSGLYPMNPQNPYKGTINGYSRYFTEDVVPMAGNKIAFDHSFLESPRIGNGSTGSFSGNYFVPGDIYEIKTTIDNQNHGYAEFCNFDINLVSGENDFNNLISDYPFPDAEEVDEKRRVSIYSTFDRAVKWNSVVHGNGSTNRLETSNFFSMPYLPIAEFEGFHIQIGPANSDNIFSA